MLFRDEMKARKLQSATEYLLTYGWAILIIAIVFAALYYLGIFGGSTSAPSAQPGSCQVLRPNGPGTSYDAALSGECNNQLPQFVGAFQSATSSYIQIPSSSQLSVTGPVTVSAWVKVNSQSGGHDQEIVIKSTQSHPTSGYELNYGWGTDIYFWIGGSSGSNAASWGGISSDIGQWVFLTGTYDGQGNANLYFNGNFVGTVSGLGNSITEGATPLYIGGGAYGVYGGCCTGQSLNGQVSNVQIYNTSLSANEVRALYLEGIGGAPIRLQNLVGWWPLNQNTNDYSGDQGSGSPTNVIYSSSWSGSYTPP